MFPPTQEEILSWEIPNWQPVSVHTTPSGMDYCTGDDVIDCPVYDNEYAKTMILPTFVQYQEDAKELYTNMSRFTGINVKGPKEAIKVRAELKVHMKNGKS